MGAMKQHAIRLADSYSLDNAEYVRDCETLALFNASEVKHLRSSVDKLTEELKAFGRIKAEHALMRVRLARMNRNKCSRMDREYVATLHSYGDEDCPTDYPDGAA